MAKAPLNKPHFEHQILESLRDEFYALQAFLRFEWYLALILLIGIAVFIYEVRPFPPRTVTIATGQPHSTYDDLGAWYKDYFAGHGVELKLVPSNGAVDNVRMLAAGEVDAAFSQGGVPVPANRRIVSLGSVQFEPMWLFHRGPEYDVNEARELLRTKKLSIGAVGSGTRYMVLDVIRQYKLDPATQANFVEMNARTSINAMLSGEIDGMFLLAGMESKELLSLLENQEITIRDFKTARAIAGKIPYAYALQFPMGAISLSPVRPQQDLDLIATTAAVLVPADMHPAIQYLFLMAGTSFYRDTHVYFDRPGGFPAFLDDYVPKSDVAAKYLQVGSASFEHTFPFWIASLIDRAWLMLAAFFAIVIPLAKLIPRYRKFHFDFDVDDRYGDLRRIEKQLDAATCAADVDEAQQQFAALERDIAGMWVPSGAKEKYYFMIAAVEVLRARIGRLAAKFGEIARGGTQ
jgi:hypothetical protein